VSAKTIDLLIPTMRQTSSIASSIAGGGAKLGFTAAAGESLMGEFIRSDITILGS
jgi:hypothetical protein